MCTPSGYVLFLSSAAASSRHHFSDPHGQRFSPSHTPLFSSSKFALRLIRNDYRNLIFGEEEKKRNERKGK